MKKRILYSFLFLLIMGCTEEKKSERLLIIPSESKVYMDENNVFGLDEFIRKKGKVILGFLNSDCSTCLVGVSLWMKFTEKHPDTTLLLIVATTGSQKVFWTQILDYYPGPIYAVLILIINYSERIILMKRKEQSL